MYQFFEEAVAGLCVRPRPSDEGKELVASQIHREEQVSSSESFAQILQMYMHKPVAKS